jgi:acetylornithine deacetylase/succinyl-diaminopimelate desuccinylase-like protein
MHMVDERVPVGDFAHLAKIYERIIASYFKTSL